jgi:hypothetical protein
LFDRVRKLAAGLNDIATGGNLKSTLRFTEVAIVVFVPATLRTEMLPRPILSEVVSTFGALHRNFLNSWLSIPANYELEIAFCQAQSATVLLNLQPFSTC